MLYSLMIDQEERSADLLRVAQRERMARAARRDRELRSSDVGWDLPGWLLSLFA